MKESWRTKKCWCADSWLQAFTCSGNSPKAKSNQAAALTGQWKIEELKSELCSVNEELRMNETNRKNFTNYKENAQNLCLSRGSKQPATVMDKVVPFYLVNSRQFYQSVNAVVLAGLGSAAAGREHDGCWHHLTKGGLGVYRGSNMIGQKE